MDSIQDESSSQSIHGFRHKYYSRRPLNWTNDLSWSLRWVSHYECTNMYGYTLDKAYGESWCKLSGFHDSLNYYIT